MNRIAITGLGAISCVGNNPQQLWAALRTGINGLEFNEELGVLQGRVRDFESAEWVNEGTLNAYQNLAVEGAGKAIFYGVAAAKMAKDHANLKKHALRDAAVFSGRGMSGFVEMQSQELDFVRGALVQDNSLTGIIAKELGVQGPTMGVGGACATGLACLYAAYNHLTHPSTNGATAIVCASDAPLHKGSYGVKPERFESRGLSTQNSFQPFVESSGTVLSEGAAAMVLERENQALQRNARIYGYIDGVSLCTHFDQNLVRVSSEGYTRSMSALDVRPQGLYVNAHGTGTALNDNAETEAIREVFGSIPFSSFKPYIGHAQAASSLLELVGCCGILNGEIDSIGGVSFEDISGIVKNSAGFNGVYGSALLRRE